MADKIPEYNPMDENRQLTMEEFIALAKQELDEYQKIWGEEPRNQYHAQTHTWNEWWNSLHRYWSW